MERKIIGYKDNFERFYTSQDRKVQEKIEYVLDLVRFEKKIPLRFFKYLHNTNGIYEIRFKTTFKSVRILFFFDKDDLLVLTNCYLKNHRRHHERK